MPELRIYPWQETQWQTIVKAINQNRMPHAVLLNGSAGMGKMAFATMCAATLLCQETSEQACGRCQSCTLFTAGSHPDFHIIAASEQGHSIKVDQIRKLIDTVSKSAYQHSKCFVIEQAQAMTTASSNALLKVLEAPTANTYIFLITEQARSLSATVRSRCQRIDFNAWGELESVKTLLLDANDEQITLAMNLSDAAPLACVEFMEDFSLREQFINDLNALCQGQLDPIVFANSCTKHDFTKCINWLCAWVEDLITSGLDCEQQYLVNIDKQPMLTGLKQKHSVPALAELLDACYAMVRNKRRGFNLNVTLEFENIACRLAKA